MSIVSENHGGRDAPIFDPNPYACIGCGEPLVAGHFVHGPQGGYCFNCNRIVLREFGCSVTELATRKG